MNPMSNSRCTSAFATSTFSSHILRGFCFLGLTCELTCSLCSISSMLSPTRSEVHHAKTSLFLSRNCKSCAYSCGLMCLLMHMALFGTLGLSATFLKSFLVSIAFLNSTEASYLDRGCTCSCCYVSSLRECMFLWSDANSHSKFLASF
jgi:hypothetical protein